MDSYAPMPTEFSCYILNGWVEIDGTHGDCMELHSYMVGTVRDNLGLGTSTSI